MKRNLLSLAATALIASGSANAALLYQITDLGLLSGGGDNTVLGINDLGQVVGASGNRAYIWNGATRTDLGGALSGSRFAAYGINNSGTVVGYDLLADRSAFQWDAVNGMQDIAALPDFSFAYGINNSGQVVGTVDDFDTFAFRLTGNTLEPIGTLDGGSFSEGRGINDSGHVVGYGDTGTGLRAFRWDGTTMHDLGDLAGGLDASFATGISNTGLVSGYSIAGDGQYATLWDASNNLVSLGDFAGGTNFSQAWDVNGSGQVVGFGIGGSGQQAFLYTAADGLLDLNSLVDPNDPLAASTFLQEARAINESGQIVGFGLINGAKHAYLLTPVPEPHEWAMMLAGLGIIGVVARRRRELSFASELRLAHA